MRLGWPQSYGGDGQSGCSTDRSRGGPISGLPPGPRMNRVVQTAIWSRRAQWMLEQCRARLATMFTLQIAYEGDLGDRLRPGA